MTFSQMQTKGYWIAFFQCGGHLTVDVYNVLLGDADGRAALAAATEAAAEVDGQRAAKFVEALVGALGRQEVASVDAAMEKAGHDALREAGA